MKARFASTIFCECNRGMEHVGSEYLRCNNPRCEHHGKKFAIPTLELVPLATEAVAGDFGLDVFGATKALADAGVVHIGDSPGIAPEPPSRQ